MSCRIVGYLLFFSCLAAYFAVAWFVRKRSADPDSSGYFFFANGGLTYPLLAATVFSSWMWTTSILGAGEAGIRYGVSGGWAYSIGATVGFAFFIPIILRIRRDHGDARTLTSFIKKRYGRLSRDLYYVFSIAVVIYIVIEQAVGVGTILHAYFGMSFRLVAFLVVIVIAVGVAYGGLSGVVFFDLLSFFIFSAIFILICVRILPVVDWADIAGVRSDQSARFFTAGGARYALTAVFVAAGQVYLDPGYYAKAMAARDSRVLRRGFLFGGVIAWLPVSILCAFIFGLYPFAILAPESGTIYDSLIHVIAVRYDAQIRLLFSTLVLLAGITTVAHCFMGIQNILATDFYSEKIEGIPAGIGVDERIEKRRIVFGRTTTILLGLFCALIAIALENISLLSLDIFSGIFFAAPCGALVVGVFSRRCRDLDAVLSIALGMIAGFGALVTIRGEGLGWYYATLLSFAVPFLFLAILIAARRSGKLE